VSSRTTEFTVVLVPRPVGGPRVRLAPQRISWANAFRHNVQVGDPRFDATFHVSTENAAFARWLLRPRPTHWLATDRRAQDAVIVFEPADVMVVAQRPLTRRTARRRSPT
jgi:hypothetical protein